MSRITDTERGARLALSAAAAALIQPDLFGSVLPVEFWRDIETAANDQLDECDALRDACRAVSHG
jgi:hypothetical protein